MRFLISGKAVIMRRRPAPRKPFTYTPLSQESRPLDAIFKDHMGHSGRIEEYEDDRFEDSEHVGELTPGYARLETHRPSHPDAPTPACLASQGIFGGG